MFCFLVMKQQKWPLIILKLKKLLHASVKLYLFLVEHAVQALARYSVQTAIGSHHHHE